jgi:hypothetical protein
MVTMRLTYANAEPADGYPEDANIVWHFDENSVTWFQQNSAEVQSALAAGAAIEPYEAPTPVKMVPDSVTARQFKMQLVIAGLKPQVDGWISSQDEIVQVAYEYSGTFVKSEPMMQAGFVALGFTDQQRDDFFLAASKL